MPTQLTWLGFFSNGFVFPDFTFEHSGSPFQWPNWWQSAQRLLTFLASRSAIELVASQGAKPSRNREHWAVAARCAHLAANGGFGYCWTAAHTGFQNFDSLINAAADPETGHIYYDDYAALLATE